MEYMILFNLQLFPSDPNLISLVCEHVLFFFSFRGDLQVHVCVLNQTFFIFCSLFVVYICSDLIYIVDVIWIFMRLQQLFLREFEN